MSPVKRKIYINRFLGRSLHFSNGFHIGFNWVHGNGRSSKTSAILMGYHHPESITWRWALYWIKPRGWRGLFCWPRLQPGYDSGKKYRMGSLFSGSLTLPLFGTLSLSTQRHMFRTPPEETVNVLP